MLSREDIQQVASLARLGLTEKELQKMQKDLSVILDYFKSLKKVDVAEVKPAFYTGPLRNIMREDKARKQDKETIEIMLKQVPAREGRYIKVKEILK